jgi:N,N'-diacetyllegionaminate synthase
VSTVSIIAEAGVNHNGSYQIAEKLVEKAANAGADIVKFQTFKACDLVTKSASKAAYQLNQTEFSETQHEMLKGLELSEEMHHALKQKCKSLNIRFASTGFDIRSVDFLVNVGVDFLKIPSGEITNLPYLRHIGQKGLPVIVSTGMSTLEEVKFAVKTLVNSGSDKNLITLLHCNTEYPTPMRDVNLKAMLTLREELGISIGYSDHTIGIEVPIAAVALGATIIEKHFTLDRSLEGPDHASSLEPHELKQMVVSIRNIEVAIGDGVKKPSNSEIKNIQIARKSIVAMTAISKGEVFTSDNLTVKRPGNGISPMEWDNLIGSKSNRDYQPDELIDIE